MPDSISKDIILVFDKMYLQKARGIRRRELTGADPDGNL